MTRDPLTQVRAYFEDVDAQLPPFSVDTIVRDRPIRETPGAPVPTGPRMPWWRTAPALVAAAMLITVAIGGILLLTVPGSSDDVAETSTTTIAPTTTVTTIPATTPTTVPPTTTIPEPAPTTGPAEASWSASGDIRIGPVVITAESMTLDPSRITLRYEITSLAPTGTVMSAEDTRLSPPVLPLRWELETANGSVTGTTSVIGPYVQFEVDEGTTIDDVTAVRLIAWKTIVPVVHDITLDAATGTEVELPDGSSISAREPLYTADYVLVAFDVTEPPNDLKVVACGDIRGLGASCFDPVPGSAWVHRNSNSDLQIAADPETPIDAIALRYRRPTWVEREGSLSFDVSDGDPEIALEFPAGFVAIDENEAIAPTSVTRYGDQLLVSVLSAARRGVDPASFDPLMGGRWVLETEAGASLDSIGMAYDDRVPGAFSIIFPIEDGSAVQPTRLRLVERWVPVEATGTAAAGAVDDIRGGLESPPVDVDLGNGLQLQVDRFDWEVSGGYLVWSVVGDRPLPVIAGVTGGIGRPGGTALLTTDAWSPPVRNFGLGNAGPRISWFSFSGSEDLLSRGGHELELRVEAEVPQPVPADLVIDLASFLS